MNTPELVRLTPSRDNGYHDAVNNLNPLFDDDSITNLRAAIRSSGFLIRHEGDEWFAIDFSSKTIINLSEAGFDTRKLEYRRFEKLRRRQSTEKPRDKTTGRGIRGMRDAASGRGENREWEVTMPRLRHKALQTSYTAVCKALSFYDCKTVSQ